MRTHARRRTTLARRARVSPSRPAGRPSVPYPTPVLLALFLLDLAAGLVVFLPLVGRRNAGVKFYRLVLVISGALSLCALVAHLFARRRDLVMFDETLVVCTVWVLMTLRY